MYNGLASSRDAFYNWYNESDIFSEEGAWKDCA